VYQHWPTYKHTTELQAARQEDTSVMECSHLVVPPTSSLLQQAIGMEDGMIALHGQSPHLDDGVNGQTHMLFENEATKYDPQSQILSTPTAPCVKAANMKPRTRRLLLQFYAVPRP
jgi:hypothetical protein